MTKYKAEIGKLKGWIGKLQFHNQRLKDMNNLKTGEILYMKRQFMDISRKIDKIMKRGKITKKDMKYIIPREDKNK